MQFKSQIYYNVQTDARGGGILSWSPAHPATQATQQTCCVTGAEWRQAADHRMM